VLCGVLQRQPAAPARAPCTPLECGGLTPLWGGSKAVSSHRTPRGRPLLAPQAAESRGLLYRYGRTYSRRPTSASSSTTASGVGFSSVRSTSSTRARANAARARLSCLRNAAADRGGSAPTRAASIFESASG